MNTDKIDIIISEMTALKVSAARMEERLIAFIEKHEAQDKKINKLETDMEAIKAWKFSSVGSIGLS